VSRGRWSDIARNGDNRNSLLAGIHQPIEEVRDAGAGGSTHCHWIAGQVSLGDSGEDAVFFVADVMNSILPFRRNPSIMGLSASPTMP
jgi:hypothetical protein